MFSFWPMPIFFVYWLWPMQFWTFKENYFVSFVNTAFIVSRGSIGWIFFLHRIRIVLPFLDFEWKISGIPAGKLCHSCRKCSFVSRLRFIVIFFCENCANFICLFCIFIDSASIWLNFLRQCLQNCTLRARGFFRGNTIGVRFFFNSSTVSEFERKFFGFMAETVRQPCQKCTFSASGTKRKNFCFEKMYKILTIFWLQDGSFRSLSGIFQKFRQNRILCFQRNILE